MKYLFIFCLLLAVARTGFSKDFIPISSSYPSTDTIPDSTSTGDYINYPALNKFIERMHGSYNFDKKYLNALFASVKRDDKILEKVNTPAEGLDWATYRNIFLTEERIANGVRFWQQNDSILTMAEAKYGVEAAYIVAILGVETAYGRNTGKHQVIQSLTTLAFDYPKRSKFYLHELEELLLLAREEDLALDTLKGSYAGAMGMAQFIASSYRYYAIDFNNDGHRNLWAPADAIGSVANYFATHGWQHGQMVAVKVETSDNKLPDIADTVARKPRHTLAQMAAAGIHFPSRFTEGKVNLIKLHGKEGSEYWLTTENFYVITRYNHSHKYAMAIYQLANEIEKRRP